MAITRTPIVDDDGSGTTGTVINNAWKQQFYDQIDAVAPGPPAWVDVPYSASNFTASGAMTWTVDAGDQLLFRYAISGKVGLILFDISNTTVGGTPGTHLDILLPVAVAPASNLVLPIWLQNPAGAMGFVNVVAATRIVQCYKDATLAANWTAGTARVVAALTIAIV